jgi:hypothetical protein
VRALDATARQEARRPNKDAYCKVRLLVTTSESASVRTRLLCTHVVDILDPGHPPVHSQRPDVVLTFTDLLHIDYARYSKHAAATKTLETWHCKYSTQSGPVSWRAGSSILVDQSW